jgi:hypothetical protein
MRSAYAVLVAGLVWGCSSSTHRDASPEIDAAEFARTFGGSQAMFVLDRVEDQRSDAVVLFDHTCAGERIQHIVRDTITLLADGHATRAFTLEFVRDGHVWNSSHLSFSGTWSANARRDVFYYSQGSSVVLEMTSDTPLASHMEMWLRIGDGGLTSLAAMGGSCPGSPNDGREREMTYSRR